MTTTKLLKEGPEFKKRMGELIARSWVDPNFKQQLVSAPKETLASMGLDAPEGVEVVFLEDTETKKHLVLPAPPTLRELSDDELVRVAARKLEAQLTLF